MSLSAPVLSSGLPLAPSDLGRIQRGVLVGGVVLAHIGLALGLMMTRDPAVKETAVPAIEVALISEEAPPPVAPAPPAPPEPPKRQPPPDAPPPRPQAAPHPAPVAPPVLASTAAPQAHDFQAPVAPPPVEVKTAPPAPAPQPAPIAAAPAAAPVVDARPAQPRELPSSAIRYLVQPPQVYPRVSKELGESGVVKLRLLIDEQGRIKNIAVLESSGYPRLDQQAVSNLRQARLQPLIENGVAREATTIASIVFSLEDQ